MEWQTVVVALPQHLYQIFKEQAGLFEKKGEGNNFIGINPHYQLVSIPFFQMIPGAFKFHAQLK